MPAIVPEVVVPPPLPPVQLASPEVARVLTYKMMNDAKSAIGNQQKASTQFAMEVLDTTKDVALTFSGRSRSAASSAPQTTPGRGKSSPQSHSHKGIWSGAAMKAGHRRRLVNPSEPCISFGCCPRRKMVGTAGARRYPKGISGKPVFTAIATAGQKNIGNEKQPLPFYSPFSTKNCGNADMPRPSETTKAPQTRGF